jgi:hypothetical protein
MGICVKALRLDQEDMFYCQQKLGAAPFTIFVKVAVLFRGYPAVSEDRTDWNRSLGKSDRG